MNHKSRTTSHRPRAANHGPRATGLIVVLFIVCLFFPYVYAEVPEQMEKLRKSTPEQVTKGKTVYLSTCMICHGSEGKGDGPASAGMNPTPRNFHSGEWKNGGTPSQVFTTVTKGFGSMPGFGALSVEDRWAVVHYIRSLSPNPPEDTPETLKLLEAFGGSSTGGSAQELPIEFIMERMVEESK